MKKIAVVLLLVFAVLLLSERVGESTGRHAEGVSGNYSLTLKHDGLQREYIVFVPSGYTAEDEVSLVLALHGGGGNIKDADNYFGLSEKAEEEGFILVYPQGTGNEVLGTKYGSWNAWECCEPALSNNVDDVGFIAKLIKEIKTNYSIDSKRVYVTGMSNGGQMSYKLACELSNVVAAVAPVGSIVYSENCEGERLVPIIHLQGVEDKCSLWEGGVCSECMTSFFNRIGVPGEFSKGRSCLSVEGYVELWRKRNACASERTVTYQERGAVCYEYEDCGADVVFCKDESLGHAWPGRETNSAAACEKNPNGVLCRAWVEEIEGDPSVDLPANDMIWDFFMAHPFE